MKISIVHSFYSAGSVSGENTVVLEQVDALRSAGHEVQLIARYTDDLKESEKFYTARASLRIGSGFGDNPSSEIEDFNPDVVHVHNLFPNLANRWMLNPRRPQVVTLHNFRPLCAAATLYRDGDTCVECPERSVWNSIRYRCYRNSRVATAPIALSNSGGLKRNPALIGASRIICLSDRAAATFARYGAKSDQLRVLPNFVRSSKTNGRTPCKTDHFVFAGRLTAEKGIDRLVDRWPDDLNLDVFGSGIAPRSRHANVRIMGETDRQQLLEKLPSYVGLVLPSQWAEGIPTIYLEAIMAGVPVIATTDNSAGDDVGISGVGVSIPRNFSTEDLSHAAYQIRRHHMAYSRQAEKWAREKYSKAAWIEKISTIYDEAIEGFAASSRSGT